MKFFIKIIPFLFLFGVITTGVYAETTVYNGGTLTITETTSVTEVPSTPTQNITPNSGVGTQINNSSTSNLNINGIPDGSALGGEDTTRSTRVADGRSTRGTNSIVSIDDLGSDKDMKLGDLANERSLRDIILNIAISIRNIFYIIASVYFIIIAIRLITTSNTEEEVQNFKKGLLYITIGIIIMNLAFSIVYYLYNDATLGKASTDVNLGNYAYQILENIMHPLIKLLETATAFFFLLVALFAFFRLITANGNEEEARRGKMSILYAILGFVLVIISAELVFAVYGNCQGGLSQTAQIFQTTCSASANLSGVVGIIIEVIKWLNGFVAVAVILMIIYSGFTIMFSGGNEEKLTNARKSLVYIIVGISILVVNFLILTFFL